MESLGSYRAAGVQMSRAQTTPASLELNEAKPAATGWRELVRN